MSSAATCLPAAFFWEDVVSMLVLALHTAYIGALLFGLAFHARYQMYIALASLFRLCA